MKAMSPPGLHKLLDRAVRAGGTKEQVIQFLEKLLPHELVKSTMREVFGEDIFIRMVGVTLKEMSPDERATLAKELQAIVEENK